MGGSLGYNYGRNAEQYAKTTAEAISTLGLTTPITIRCAITVIAAVPIIIVYPFLQKYFVTGIALGSVKE